MITKTLETFAGSMGMNIADDCVFGIYGGFFMTVTEKRSAKTVEISCCIGDSEEYSEDYVSINDAISSVVEKYYISDYGVDESYVSVTSRAPLSLFREMIDYLAGMLDSLEIYKSDHCAKCGEVFKNDSDRRIVTVKTSKELHKSMLCSNCALLLAETEDTQKAAAAEGTEKLGKGLLISALAALGAAVVYVLLFWLTGVNGRMDMLRFAPCLAAIAIGGLAAFAYGKAAGRYSVKGLVALSVIIAVVTVIAHYFGCVFGFVKFLSSEKGVFSSASFGAFPSVLKIQFTDSSCLQFFVIGSVIALCCAFIALIFVYGAYIKKKDSLKKTSVSIQKVK